jgi:Plasmid pRiA4b ORF-3-like protein
MGALLQGIRNDLGIVASRCKGPALRATAVGQGRGRLIAYVQRYGIPDVDGIYETLTLDDRRHKVGAVLGESVSGSRYTYEFGDNWRHTVTVEDRLLPDESFNTWPVCIAGQNACPPGDVGGVGGYADFLETISDPSHDEHAAMWQWSGGPFDPAGFDLNATNAAAQVALTHVGSPFGDFEQGWTRTRRRVGISRNRDRGNH